VATSIDRGFRRRDGSNIDHVLTQLRVSQAQSQLPADVNNYGLTVKKSTTAPLMLIAL